MVQNVAGRYDDARDGDGDTEVLASGDGGTPVPPESGVVGARDGERTAEAGG